jgi:hypothetical protein
MQELANNRFFIIQTYGIKIYKALFLNALISKFFINLLAHYIGRQQQATANWRLTTSDCGLRVIIALPSNGASQR